MYLLIVTLYGWYAELKKEWDEDLASKVLVRPAVLPG